ncbi:hypothetical protein ABZU32_31030 [Sphaerisporangium sp. NPDC005288]|uniref:hypothetical protein n=1 Tax=Sphaerisporangium sp. NPDC005288 TaxID=3155114 RepID=UPI0033A7DF36
MIGWMRRIPRWAVALILVYVVTLVFVGTVSHLVDLARGGLRPYHWAPGWLNLFWTSLTIFDTAAAALLILGRRVGVDLTCAIMVTDLAANWYAVYGIQHSDFLAQPGLQRLTTFALFVFVTAPLLRRRGFRAPPAGAAAPQAPPVTTPRP